MPGTVLLLAASPAGKGCLVDAASVLPVLAAVPPAVLSGTDTANVVELADPLEPQAVLTRLRAAAAAPGPLTMFVAGQLQLDRRQRLPHLALARTTPSTVRYTGFPWHWFREELRLRAPGSTSLLLDLHADAEAWEWLLANPLDSGRNSAVYGRVAPPPSRRTVAGPTYMKAVATLLRSGLRPPLAQLHHQALTRITPETGPTTDIVFTAQGHAFGHAPAAGPVAAPAGGQMAAHAAVRVPAASPRSTPAPEVASVSAPGLGLVPAPAHAQAPAAASATGPVAPPAPTGPPPAPTVAPEPASAPDPMAAPEPASAPDPMAAPEPASAPDPMAASVVASAPDLMAAAAPASAASAGGSVTAAAPVPAVAPASPPTVASVPAPAAAPTPPSATVPPPMPASPPDLPPAAVPRPAPALTSAPATGHLLAPAPESAPATAPRSAPAPESTPSTGRALAPAPEVTPALAPTPESAADHAPVDPHSAIAAAVESGRHEDADALAALYEQGAVRTGGAGSREALHWGEVRADLAMLAGDPARSCRIWMAVASARLGAGQGADAAEVEAAVDRAHHQWGQITDAALARELGPALAELRGRVPGRRRGALENVRQQLRKLSVSG